MLPPRTMGQCRYRGGWTFLELLLVLLLLGLVAALVMLSVRGRLNLVLDRQFDSELAWADSLLRDAARSSQKTCVLKIDLEQRRVFKEDQAGGQSGWREVSPRCPIRVVRIAGATIDSNHQAEIVYRADGSSPTWAYQRQDGSWCLWAGGTGQRIERVSSDSLEKVFASLEARDHPD